MKPTPEEIKAEIAKLREMKPHIRHYSLFNDNNWDALDAQIEFLEGEMSEDDIRENWPGEYAQEYMRAVALEAWMWLNDDEDAELPSDTWAVLLVEPDPPVEKTKPQSKGAKKISGKTAKKSIKKAKRK